MNHQMNSNWNPDQLDGDYVPKPWTRGLDQNGQAYYVNTETGQIRRQPPITAGAQTYQKANAFIDPEQWDLVIETMASTIHPQQQLRIFQKLKKIAEKMITKDDPKYRTLYLNNPKLQHTVLAFDGGLEFLYNLGFEPHAVSRDKLVCHEVNSRVVQACLICLEDKIDFLYEVNKQSLLDDDPNLHSNSQYINQYNQYNQYNNQNSSDLISQQQEYIAQLNQQFGQDSLHNSQINHANTPPPPPPTNNSDKEQVMVNLSGLGFNTMLKNQAKNKPISQSHHILTGIHDIKYNKSDHVNVNNANNGYNNMHMNGSASKSMSKSIPQRPIPPPPITKHIHNGSKEKINQMLGLEEKKAFKQHKKMYKTFIFLRHGNSIWNRFKNSGRKRKWAAVAVGIGEYLRTKNNPQNHADTWVVDAPLSRVGIDEAYGLSRFLGRHLTLRQFESLADLEHHQSLATPIKDALRIINVGILDKYQNELTHINNGDLLRKCQQIKQIMDSAHKRIQEIMLETEVRRNHNAKALGYGAVGHVTKGGDYIDDDEKDEVKNDEISLQNGHNNDNELHVPNELKNVDSPNLNRIFSHVVIANQVENVEEQDDLEMPLEMEWVLDQMIDSSNNSIVVTSNLRRAISTAVIALWDRFGANKECIHILPCLQELGMNVDTHTPILSSELPHVSNFEKTSKKLNVSKLTEFYASRLMIEKSNISFGKKSLRESGQDTQQRLNFFCDWAFRKNDENGNPYNTIIACGHSHWMRAFFKTFLPKDTQSMAGKRKLQNCGVVGFRMICHIGPENQRDYEIIGRSITPIYRGFV